jgi:50S ribosomal subunit-associated GTPase HflX
MAIAASQGRQVFPVSALSGSGLDALRQALADFASAHMLAVDLLLPYSEAALLDLVRQNGRIDAITYLPEGIQASVHVRYSQYAQLQPYLTLAENSEER